MVGVKQLIVFRGGGSVLAMNLNQGGLSPSPDAVGNNEAENHARSAANKHIQYDPGRIMEDSGGSGETVWSKRHRLEAAILIGRNQAIAQIETQNCPHQKKRGSQQDVIKWWYHRLKLKCTTKSANENFLDKFHCSDVRLARLGAAIGATGAD